MDPALQADLKQVITLMPRLFEEAFKISLSPINQLGYSFMRPALSFLEFSQCFTQAVAPSARKAAGSSDKIGQSGDGIVSLLQLPHVDERVATNLNRKKCRNLGDLLAMRGESARVEALKAAGMSDGAAADVEAHLKFAPRAEVFTASVETEGEDTTIEFDVVTCTVNLRMARGALPEEVSLSSKEKEGEEGSAAAAVVAAAAAAEGWGGGNSSGGLIVTGKDDLPPLPFCTHCEREEGWWLFVTDPAANYTLSYMKLDAKAMEEAQRNPKGKQFQLKFNVSTAGTYSLSVLLISDYWIGLDAKWACKVKVLKRTKDIVEARSAAALAAEKKSSSGAVAGAKKGGAGSGGGDEGGEGEAEGGGSGSSDGEGDDSDSDSDDGSGKHGDDDYPSEETGTEESSDDEEDDAFYAGKKNTKAAPAAKVAPAAAPALGAKSAAKGEAVTAADKDAKAVEAEKKPAAPAESST